MMALRLWLVGPCIGAPRLESAKLSPDSQVSRTAHEKEMTAAAHGAPPATWGRGVVREVRATLGTWWVVEMTNPNLKTIAVSFFL
jgi:hypothetical protein